MHYKASHRHADMSARKIRPFAALIRGRSADEALELLRFLHNMEKSVDPHHQACVETGPHNQERKLPHAVRSKARSHRTRKIIKSLPSSSTTGFS